MIIKKFYYKRETPEKLIINNKTFNYLLITF